MQMAADRPRFYEEVNPKAFKFIRDVPVNWETALPIMGSIGEYYVVARKERNGPNWFIGGVTNEDPHKVRIQFDFLDEGEYVIEVYRDHETAHYRDNPLAISIESTTITKKNFIVIWMAPGGGFAASVKKRQ
jgi:hypothetical protein